ncbi:hypothetical protein PRIPAC_93737 [Pristionchus pacificus]|uniref:Uncharacterized protein n=1 Tax=Pristionchus pacificus TaxID=54126 RepID=A0A2A6CCP3_PRIPA|nr:hypothetical protein PRIPAC_93737 [Pristionchus pacificus]|eukprot:PDM76005.1 hypothetical protein PRIPAC_39609 [Pristionchus pacificus]
MNWMEMLNNTISFLLSLLIPTTVEPMTMKHSADVAANAPWYLPRTELFIDSSGPAQSPPVDLTECSKECITVEDCPFDQSCFGATLARPGCCLPDHYHSFSEINTGGCRYSYTSRIILAALTPNATGCVSDEQCRRSCDSTVCDMEQQPSRCLCEPGTHFLFEKCWKRCPPFAEERPIVDERGIFFYILLRENCFSYCKLRTSESVARLVMHRSKRSIGKNAFC